MKREMEIQQVRTQNKVTYAEAVKMVGKRGEIDERNRAGKQPIIEADQTNESKVMVDLKKLVTFIAGVVNVTMDIKSKTERIQIIVKAAALDISGMTWEEVRNELSTQASQEQIGNG